MFILASEGAAAVREMSVAAGAPNPRHRLTIHLVVGRGARAVVLLMLSIASLASSISFLASIGIVLPIVTGQFGDWLQSGRWQRVPIAKLLAQMGYQPQFEASSIASIANWCLSGESVVLIVLAAAAFVWSVWMLESASRGARRAASSDRLRGSASQRYAGDELHYFAAACFPDVD